MHKNASLNYLIRVKIRHISSWKTSNSQQTSSRQHDQRTVHNRLRYHNHKSDHNLTDSGFKYVTSRSQQQSNQNLNEKEELEDEDEDEVEFIPFVVKKHPPSYFYDLCRRLAADGKLAECVAVVEKRMVKDRVRPEKFNYSVVIHALGKAGQPRKAFDFFRKMRTAGFVPNHWVINSLLNACANSTSSESEFSMKQAKWLLERERQLYGPPRPTTYFAAMKCFARHGDVATVFRLADDMIRDGYKIVGQVFTSLLSACVSDKESGFKLALDVWSAMTASKIKPSIYDYRLLLKICRECGVGKKGNHLLKEMENKYEKDVRLFLKKNTTTDLNNRYLIPAEYPMLEPGSEFEVHDIQNVSLIKLEEKFPPISERSLKLTMMGNVEGLLNNMKQNKVVPDFKIFHALHCLLPTFDKINETKLISFAKLHNVKLDTEFYNAIIRARCQRNDAEGALAILDEMRQTNLTPDIRTFDGLAYSCTTNVRCLKLLRDMNTFGIRPTLKIFDILLKHSFRWMNLFYARTVILQMQKFNVNPDEHMLRFIDTKLEIARKQIWQKDVQIPDAHSINVHDYNDFLELYKQWTSSLFVHYKIDAKLTALDKTIDIDDLREDWEKPWVKDEKKSKELKEMGNIEVVP